MRHFLMNADWLGETISAKEGARREASILEKMLEKLRIKLMGL